MPTLTICNMKLYSKDYVNIHGLMTCLDCKMNTSENALISLCMIISGVVLALFITQ